jgi:hypothetical protein
LTLLFSRIDGYPGIDHYLGIFLHFALELDSPIPTLVSWWRSPTAFMLDVTNDDAVAWFLGNLRHLQTAYNVSSFKFDAGDGNWLPTAYTTHTALDSPDAFSRKFIQMAYRLGKTCLISAFVSSVSCFTFFFCVPSYYFTFLILSWFN